VPNFTPLLRNLKNSPAEPSYFILASMEDLEDNLLNASRNIARLLFAKPQQPRPKASPPSEVAGSTSPETSHNLTQATPTVAPFASEGTVLTANRHAPTSSSSTPALDGWSTEVAVGAQDQAPNKKRKMRDEAIAPVTNDPEPDVNIAYEDASRERIFERMVLEQPRHSTSQ